MKLKIYQLQFLICLFSSVFVDFNCEYVYRTKYINVLLDHFSFTDDRTFQLRYLINDTYWDVQKGPIFFYTGNEGDINTFAQNTGFLWESAVTFKALILFAEHRYYGTSLPFGNKTFDGPEYIGYLTSEQALADFVDVIYHVQAQKNEQYESKKNHRNPIIAFGGSYGGMLAAWMRMKYPAVIEGALASSAPIWQFTNMVPCGSFYQVATSAFNSSSIQCVDNIRKSWLVLDNITSTESGQIWINENWQLCTPIKTAAERQNLKNWLLNTYINMAMINYPYPTSFLMPVPGHPVAAMCHYLSNPNLDDRNLLMGVFNAAGVYFNYTGSAKCFDWTVDPSNIGIAGWNIQSCNEMVMPMCGDGVSDMFWPSNWNFQDESQQCYTQYKIRPREFMAEKMYGGKDLRAASNIIFSNGLLDPWKSGGVTYSTNPKITVVLIEKSAHHLDLRSSNAEDPESVIEARALYSRLFKKWIKNFHKQPVNEPAIYFK